MPATSQRSWPLYFLLTICLTAIIGLLTLDRATATASAALQPVVPFPPAGSLWQPLPAAVVPAVGERQIVPNRFESFAADTGRLNALLAAAPLELTASAPAPIWLPLPDGQLQRFLVTAAPIMAPALAARFPELTTYVVKGVDDPAANGRLDRTPAGFHAIVFGSQGQFFIDPFQTGDITHYISYFKRDYTFAGERPPESGPLGSYEATVDRQGEPLVPTGSELRTYRLAVAATGEYTTFHGGTVPAAMAAIITTMNRVNAIYEREIAVRLELVANNNLIIYTNAATDPYNNNDLNTMLAQNQANLDAVIGSGNYDIGHVFGTSGGGLAYLGVPCRADWKARAGTGLSTPAGDQFAVDYVSHEMGHQFGANHSFNSSFGVCASNRNPSTAYEPGSGSTIMSYSGLCGDQNLQVDSDDYFHTVSYEEMVTYTTLGSGNSCPAITSTGNDPPAADAGPSGLTIPIDTPFMLTGAGSDGNNDPLVYSWEQFDLGPAGHPNNPVGNAPIFRTFPAVSNPTRTFPRAFDLVNNSQTIGEILPGYGRGLTFRLIVRDNHTPGGGVNFDTISLSVTETAGPFQVTMPNTTMTWFVNGPARVTWEPANTTAAPVNCSAVNIDLSLDGGYTYPTSLAAGAANSGLALISVPDTPSGQARVRVSCASSVFFDISNADFVILDPVGGTYLPLVARE